MTIKEVYERFKHLDPILSNPYWGEKDNDSSLKIMHEFWQAIKAEARGEE